MTYTLPNLKDKPYGGAWSIHEQETVDFVTQNTQPLAQPDVKNFLNDYYQWMQEGHKINGIQKY